MSGTIGKFDMGFKNKFEIDTSGGLDPKSVTDATFARLAAGVSSVTPAKGETTDNTVYYDTEDGNGNMDVTGMAVTLAFSGHRLYGDPAQDFVASKFTEIGDSVKTLCRWTETDGTVFVSQCTITALVPFGGNANAKQTFSFTLNMNGTIVKQPPTP
ncbi:phage tail tube protein [Listeria fleischmannii]|uniref:Capsid protein n=1 Tax=Listeria fleischmannii FSL S10-1203 TaxID=1265822 RepID=W7D6I4_9LIST|nr:hypothetical protein [Listeria fleischmannii]EUJ47652.1 hypothetical protein MCOL2_18069 [Listeria fleischmannii FSL S10-1203]